MRTVKQDLEYSECILCREMRPPKGYLQYDTKLQAPVWEL